jgi:uncharacterized protein
MILRSDLDHLPARKRRQLDDIVRIIFEEFEEAQKLKLSPRRKGRILKVILFGSHARGDHVEDRRGGYFSDYDILIIVDRDELTAMEDYWYKAEDRFTELSLRSNFRFKASLIVHTLQDVNDQLARGRYFFMDIAREGIALYEAKGHPLFDPQPLPEDVALEEARDYFEEWYTSATEFMDLAQLARERSYLKRAAFLLHQATESLYHCTLLVLTLYTPAIHNIGKLHNRCVDRDRRFLAIWPNDSRFVRRSFQRLKRAYVEGRYSKHYRITREELDWLIERVKALQDLVKAVCEERIAAGPAQVPGGGETELR